MYRFYVTADQIGEEEAFICGSDVNHIKNVLRLTAGEWVVLCDGNNTDYCCRIKSVSSEEVVCHIEKTQPSNTELDTKIYLFQGLPKKDKMDLIVQKAVELGVSSIIPVYTKRCVVKLDEKKAAKKQERWQKIAESAAKQCDRGLIPVVEAPVTLAKAFDIAGELEYNMIPYECADGMERAREIVAEAVGKKSVGVFIGPEGGFEAEEVEQAVEKGCQVLTLGKRILRTETAGMAVLSILMFQLQK